MPYTSFLTFFCDEPNSKFFLKLLKTFEKLNTYSWDNMQVGSTARIHHTEQLLNSFGVPGFGPCFAIGGPGGEGRSLSWASVSPPVKWKRGTGLGTQTILISV